MRTTGYTGGDSTSHEFNELAEMQVWLKLAPARAPLKSPRLTSWPWWLQTVDCCLDQKAPAQGSAGLQHQQEQACLICPFQSASSGACEQQRSGCLFNTEQT